MRHDGPKRARSWKRRIQAKESLKCIGSPLLGEMDRIVGAMANLGPAISDRTAGNILRGHRIGPAPERSRKTTFYEKVVKVKADVAAILNFFLPISQI